MKKLPGLNEKFMFTNIYYLEKICVKDYHIVQTNCTDGCRFPSFLQDQITSPDSLLFLLLSSFKVLLLLLLAPWSRLLLLLLSDTPCFSSLHLYIRQVSPMLATCSWAKGITFTLRTIFNFFLIILKFLLGISINEWGEVCSLYLL